ncbi:hypothetical protein Tco_0788658, partial [Tanacetum coccineum]
MFYPSDMKHKTDESANIKKGGNKEDPWRQQQVIEGCRDKEKKGFHVLVFQTEAGFLDRQQESIKEFLRIWKFICGMFHDQGSNKEDPWRQQQVIEGCRDKEKKGFHVLVFQTKAEDGRLGDDGEDGEKDGSATLSRRWTMEKMEDGEDGREGDDET